MRVALAAAFVSLGLGACLPHARLQRMQSDLVLQVQRGDLAEASTLEARIAELADRAYGAWSRDALWERSNALETLACWRHGDVAAEKALRLRADAEAALGATDERVLIPTMTRAYALATARRWQEGESSLDEIAAMCRPKYGRLAESGVCGWWASGELAYRYDGMAAFGKAAEESIAFRKNFLPMFARDPLFQSSVLTNIGERYAAAGLYPEALSYLRRSLELARPHYDRVRPEHATLWSDENVSIAAGNAAHSFLSQEPRCLEVLLRVLPRVGEDEEARRLTEWRRNLWRRGPDLEASLREKRRFAEKAWNVDRLTSDHAHDLAFYLVGKERPADAVVAYQDAVAMLERNMAGGRKSAFCSGSVSYLDLLLGLASALDASGRPDEAAETWTRAALYADLELPPRHPLRWEPYAALADLQLRRGQLDDAQRSWRRFLDLVAEQRGREHADYAFGLHRLSEVLGRNGSQREASRLHEQAHDIFRRVHVEIAATPPPAP